MVQELRSFASQRPGGFLLGALAAGLVTGRVVRGATAAGHDEPASSPSYPPAAATLPVLDPAPYAAGVPAISTVAAPARVAPVADDVVDISGTTTLERDAWSR